ncbi:MAG: DUF1028 domain-containing protein [Flavobacteriales bacterium]|nr:DUF1028 domain-containing protein [Flavobacteriales bacterium]
MKSSRYLSIGLLLLLYVSSYATFSIVAVDPLTGQVGSAGASCSDGSGCGGCGGVVVINGIVPGVGAINAQGVTCFPDLNLQNGMNWMRAGHTPSQIISDLTAHDKCFQGGVSQRQYGIVGFDDNDNPVVATYTGSGCAGYASQRIGYNYSIQGSNLLGKEVLDSMAARFERETGSLACKLMAALQAAKVVGADTRCAAAGVSSLSSYLRVAESDDESPNFFINLVVSGTPEGVDPIDELQSLFDQSYSCTVPVGITQIKGKSFLIYPNPASDIFHIRSGSTIREVMIYDMLGNQVVAEAPASPVYSWDVQQMPDGMYMVRVRTDAGWSLDRLIVSR